MPLGVTVTPDGMIGNSFDSCPVNQQTQLENKEGNAAPPLPLAMIHLVKIMFQGDHRDIFVAFAHPMMFSPAV